jgi:hypothetical protein
MQRKSSLKTRVFAGFFYGFVPSLCSIAYRFAHAPGSLAAAFVLLFLVLTKNKINKALRLV